MRLFLSYQPGGWIVKFITNPIHPPIFKRGDHLWPAGASLTFAYPWESVGLDFGASQILRVVMRFSTTFTKTVVLGGF